MGLVITHILARARTEESLPSFRHTKDVGRARTPLRADLRILDRLRCHERRRRARSARPTKTLTACESYGANFRLTGCALSLTLACEAKV